MSAVRLDSVIIYFKIIVNSKKMKEFTPLSSDIHHKILNKLTFNSIKYIPVSPYSSAYGYGCIFFQS